MLLRQLEAVFAELPPRAVKTGMLFSAANFRVVADFLGARPASSRVPLVVDPVMVSTSGSRLLESSAERILREKLLPLATLVTPNLDEIKALLGGRPDSPAEMGRAAREIHRRFGCAVLVKGGHLRRPAEAIDVFFDGATEWELAAPRVPGLRTHGTGCTYSAAICAALALGSDLTTAVRMGKLYITSAIANSYRVGAHWALGPGCVDVRKMTGHGGGVRHPRLT